MSAKIVLYFTAQGHTLYRWSGGQLEQDASFSPDDAGLEEFRAYLKGHRGALAYVVADLAGEDFHEDHIPYLRGGDRQLVVQRRLAQRYRDTRLAAALPLGFTSGERRSERLLLASFTNTQQFVAWLDALAESGARLSGVYSAPLLAPALAQRIGVKGGRCFVITANAAGLRQSYIEDGRLRFARLERATDLAPEALALFVRSETQRLAQYLATLRALPREGPPVQVVVVAPPGQRAVFEQALVSDARLAFLTVDQAEAARKVGIKRPAPGPAELLYLHSAVKRPPKEQFARVEDRRSYFIWQLKRYIVGAGVAGFAACALYAGAGWLDILNVRGQIEAQRREARAATQQYERITATFPVTQTTTENLRITVVEFTRVVAGTSTPEGAMVHLSRVLEQFPQIELEGLVWSVGRVSPAKPEAGAAAPAPAPAPAAPGAAPATPADRAQLLEISGRVEATQRSDYRGITQQVQRFAAALTADGTYRTVRTQLPFDVTPDGTLSGDIGETAGKGEAPRFTIIVSRNLQ